MKIEISENSEIVLKEVYNHIMLKTNNGEELYICMRDSGFEINYEGIKYELKLGKINMYENSL